MNNEVTPTLTLAKLYETQDQFLDAFLVYQKINKENPSQETADKMKELQNKIFNNIKSEYNEIIGKIFSPEEIRKFRILPHEDYLEMTRVEEEPENITDITESPDDPEIKIFKSEIDQKIDLSDFSSGLQFNDAAKDEPHEIKTESVDVPDQPEDELSEKVDEVTITDNNRPDQIPEQEIISDQSDDVISIEDQDDAQSLPENDSDTSLNEILKDIQSVDLNEFVNFLKETDGKESDLAEYKLSQLQEALKKFKK